MMEPPFRCMWCDELVMPGDMMHALLPGYHYACAMRVGMGSLGHVEERCSCYVKDGTHEEDPPGLTKRQAARIVADYVNTRQWGQPVQPGRN